jgi:hypothetical protein
MATTAELKSAFKRSGLWRLGWTYDQAIGCDNVRRCMEISARCRREHQARRGNPAPVQPELI